VASPTNPEEQKPSEDMVDGCDVVLADKSVTYDDEVDGIVLFASCKSAGEVAVRKAEWQELFSAS
jgi:hypothetical protein